MTPGNAVAAYLIGKAYADAKQWDRAKTYLDKASELATGKLSDLVREQVVRAGGGKRLAERRLSSE